MTKPAPVDPKDMSVWSWRDAIRKARVPFTTKHVCNMIANYLSDCGQGCFPSVATLAWDCNLSERSLTTHIQAAIDAGLLTIKRRTGPDGRRKRTLYLPQFPAGFTLARTPAKDTREIVDESDDADDDHPHVLLVDGTRMESGISDENPPEAHADGPPEADDVNPPANGAHKRTIHRELSKTPNPEFRGTENDLNIGDDQEDTLAVLSKGKRLLADLRSDGRHHNVVESLLAPILTQRRFSADDAIGELRSIRSAAKDLPTPALEKAAAIVLAGPKTVKADRIRDALKAAKLVARADAADAVPTDPDTERVRSALRKRLGEDVYRSWFAGMTVRNDGGRMLLVAPTRMHASWIISNYTLHVEAVAGASARVVHAGEIRT